MMAMIVPGQAVFLFCIHMMQGGHQSMTALFISLYMMCSVGVSNFFQTWHLINFELYRRTSFLLVRYIYQKKQKSLLQ